MDYLLHVVTVFGIYATLAVSLSLAAGQAGLLSLAHAALYGVGAYTTAILAIQFGIPLAGGLLAAGMIAAVAAVPLAIAGNRVRGDHFVVATLGYQVLATSVFENWSAVTGGPLGLSGVPRRIFGPWVLSTNLEFALVALALAGVTLLAASRLSRSAFGRVLHCIRDDEDLGLSLGKDVRLVKLQVLAMSCAMAGVAGGLYAAYATYVDPSSFTVNESIAIAAMAIIGGLRTVWGPVLGAAVLVLLPELLRFSGFPHTIAASLQQVIFGAALVWIVMNRPSGLVGRTGEAALGPVQAAGK